MGRVVFAMDSAVILVVGGVLLVEIVVGVFVSWSPPAGPSLCSGGE
jgi:hypothetical protein